jgi:hypothetical protein
MAMMTCEMRSSSFTIEQAVKSGPPAAVEDSRYS